MGLRVRGHVGRRRRFVIVVGSCGGRELERWSVPILSVSVTCYREQDLPSWLPCWCFSVCTSCAHLTELLLHPDRSIRSEHAVRVVLRVERCSEYRFSINAHGRRDDPLVWSSFVPRGRLSVWVRSSWISRVRRSVRTTRSRLFHHGGSRSHVLGSFKVALVR